jgi:hypothetical protein
MQDVPAHWVVWSLQYQNLRGRQGAAGRQSARQPVDSVAEAAQAEGGEEVDLTYQELQQPARGAGLARHVAAGNRSHGQITRSCQVAGDLQPKSTMRAGWTHRAATMPNLMTLRREVEVRAAGWPAAVALDRRVGCAEAAQRAGRPGKSVWWFPWARNHLQDVPVTRLQGLANAASADPELRYSPPMTSARR